jgi:hypothetical protein
LALIVALSLALAVTLAVPFALGIALTLVALALVFAIALAVFAITLTSAALIVAIIAFDRLAIIARLTYIFALRLVSGAATRGRLRVYRRLRGRLLVKHV